MPNSVHDISVGSEGQGRSVKLYHYKPESGSNPCVIFVPGFMSNGKGLKARFLKERCAESGFEFVSYDPEGLGDSPGNLGTVEFKHWVEDAEVAINFTSSQKIVLVGSSMGGMIALKMAMKYPEKIQRLFLIAPAVNTLYEKYQDWYENVFDDEAKKILDRGDTYIFKSDYGPMPVRKAFFENFKREGIDLSEEEGLIDVTCPVKIIHGMLDESVPYRNSIELLSQIKSDQLDLIIRKDGEHRLARDEDLNYIWKNLVDLMKW